MPFFTRENIEFHYFDRGSGVPVVFQHGLGGDIRKIFSLIDLPPGFRLLGMDSRAHGQTAPVGPVEKLRFDSFADDLLALLDHCHLDEAVLGGTSMGAGVSLNVTLRYPQRVRGLIMLRPAWLDQPNPVNVQLFDAIARLLRTHGPEKGQDLFARIESFRAVAQESSDTAESLLALFTDPRAVETVARLESIPRDIPNRDRADWTTISVPTLVMATERDPVHPFEFAKILANSIPNARFQSLTPKAVDLVRYGAELNRCLTEFLQHHFIC